MEVDDSVMYVDDGMDGDDENGDRSTLDIRRIEDSGCRRNVENVLANE